MWHSCSRVTVRDHTKGKPRHLVQLYREVGRLVRSFGPGVSTVSSRTRTGWMARARFAGVEFRRDHVVLAFWLKREISHPRLRVEHYGRSDWGYRLALRSPADIDDELRGWLREAYLVGRQEWSPSAASSIRAREGGGRRAAAPSR
jgi:hypothetical protein